MQQLHPKAVWLFFIKSLMGGIFLFIFFGMWGAPLLLVAVMAAEKLGMIATGLLIFAVFYIIFCYFWAKWNYNAWRYELSEDAIKIEKGVILKKYISIPYERVQNVDIYRGVFARILGLSDLHIQTAGYSGGYGRHGRSMEGRLPGLGIKTAEEMREELIRRLKGTKQGL